MSAPYGEWGYKSNHYQGLEGLWSVPKTCWIPDTKTHRITGFRDVQLGVSNTGAVAERGTVRSGSIHKTRSLGILFQIAAQVGTTQPHEPDPQRNNEHPGHYQ